MSFDKLYRYSYSVMHDDIDILSYAVDTTFSVFEENVSSTAGTLEKSSALLLQWLSDNRKKNNTKNVTPHNFLKSI